MFTALGPSTWVSSAPPSSALTSQHAIDGCCGCYVDGVTQQDCDITWLLFPFPSYCEWHTVKSVYRYQRHTASRNWCHLFILRGSPSGKLEEEHERGSWLIQVCLQTKFIWSPFYRTTWVIQYQKYKPFWILLKQRWWGGSDISCTICKSFAPLYREITMPTPHHSSHFYYCISKNSTDI